MNNKMNKIMRQLNKIRQIKNDSLYLHASVKIEH